MRHAVLSVALAVLIVSAGCSSVLTDGNSTAEGTAQAPGTQTPIHTNNPSDGQMPANGSDIRSLSIPLNQTTTVYGEIDGGDPTLEETNRYYEPIVFAAEAGDTINVSMSSIANDPELRLRNPNGTTVAVDDNGSDGNNAAAGVYQVDNLLKTKLRDSGLEQSIRIVALNSHDDNNRIVERIEL
jgi:uncharacterized protein YceK